MNNSKFKQFFPSFIIGSTSTILFWLSIIYFSELESIFALILMVLVTVLLLQNKHFEVLACNIAFYLIGIITSYTLEYKFDFFHLLFKLINPETKMSAGDGFGIIIFTPIYICAFSLSIIIAVVVTCIKNKK